MGLGHLETLLFLATRHVCTRDHLKKINVTDKWDTILDSPGHGKSKMTHFKINFVHPFLLYKITVKNTAKSQVYYLKMSFLTNLLQWTDKVDFKTHHFGIPMTWEVQNCISLASNIYLCQTSSGAYVHNWSEYQRLWSLY